MGKLNWFQRLTTREVVGKVTERDFVYRGIVSQPVTLYSVTQEDETLYRGAMIGHQSSPDLGDNVEMYLKKGDFLVRKPEQIQRPKSDGSVEVIDQTTVWEAIKSYRVLEDLV